MITERAPPCPHWQADTAHIWPGISLGDEAPVCRHWLGGIACRLPDTPGCLTAGRRESPEDQS